MNARPADSLKIALAQLNPTVGDVAGNAEKVRRARDEAAKFGADVVAFPELFLAGYPPEDLVLKPAFQAACRAAVEALARESTSGPALLVGTPWVEDGKLYNAYALLADGAVEALRYKVDLPNYGVFDEKRVFAPGPMPGPILIKGVRIGIPICEDIWGPEVVECVSETGGEILLVPNGSPYWRGKTEHRLNIAVARVVESGLPLVYLNMVGGQDELVFDGASFVLNADRSVGAQLPTFRETVALTEWKREAGGWRCVNGPITRQDENEKTDYGACVLGLQDYVNKSGFKGVVLGLSGGVDSALCATMAVDALGKDRVRCVMLPYRYTSEESLADAAQCAKALGVQYDIVPIEQAVLGLEATLKSTFEGRLRDVTEENLQARARGVILMAISNKFGLMVVTTGNKSEMSVGYATLYGDMNGGFNPIKDLYKTQVFGLCRLRNSWKPETALGPAGEVIPENIIVKPPTAELRENQKDQDSLPPYDMLDQILERLVEREEPVASIVAAGFERDIVLKVARLLDLAEYKRRQAAPGVKVTLKNFGRDRRYPIVNRFRDSGEPLPQPDRTLLKAGAASKTEAFDF
jgi:NAD+ synthase